MCYLSHIKRFAFLPSAGTLTVEQIYQDRDQFAKLVREVAAPDVGRMGIEILSFTIKVHPDVGYCAVGHPAALEEAQSRAFLALAPPLQLLGGCVCQPAPAPRELPWQPPQHVLSPGSCRGAASAHGAVESSLITQLQAGRCPQGPPLPASLGLSCLSLAARWHGYS